MFGDLGAIVFVGIISVLLVIGLVGRPSRARRGSVDEALAADALDREEEERRNRAVYEDAQMAIRMKGGGG